MTEDQVAEGFHAIAAEIDPNGNLPRLPWRLRDCAAGIAGAAYAEATSPSADDIRDTMDDVKQAARFLTAVLRQPHFVGHLDAAKPSRMDMSRDPADFLRDLAERATAARQNLQVKSGAKPFANPGGLSAKEICAAVVLQAWTDARGKPPGARAAIHVCDDYWQACGQPTIGLEVEGWRRHLRVARELLPGPQPTALREAARVIILRLFEEGGGTKRP